MNTQYSCLFNFSFPFPLLNQCLLALCLLTVFPCIIFASSFEFMGKMKVFHFNLKNNEQMKINITIAYQLPSAGIKRQLSNNKHP